MVPCPIGEEAGLTLIPIYGIMSSIKVHSSSWGVSGQFRILPILTQVIDHTVLPPLIPILSNLAAIG